MSIGPSIISPRMNPRVLPYKISKPISIPPKPEILSDEFTPGSPGEKKGFLTRLMDAEDKAGVVTKALNEYSQSTVGDAIKDDLVGNILGTSSFPHRY